MTPNFRTIPIPIPPCLPEALEFPDKSRYVALTYEATDCYVYDGKIKFATSYWIFSELIEHPSILPHLTGCDLGSDETLPTQPLLPECLHSHGTAQHYIGWTNDLDQRIRTHRKGNPYVSRSQWRGNLAIKEHYRASKLCAYAKSINNPFIIAEIWRGGTSLERALKRRKRAADFCPICQKSLTHKTHQKP